MSSTGDNQCHRQSIRLCNAHLPSRLIPSLSSAREPAMLFRSLLSLPQSRILNGGSPFLPSFAPVQSLSFPPFSSGTVSSRCPVLRYESWNCCGYGSERQRVSRVAANAQNVEKAATTGERWWCSNQICVLRSSLELLLRLRRRAAEMKS